MFFSLIFASFQDSPPSLSNRTILSTTPGSCDGVYDISNKAYYRTTLKKGKKPCFITKGTLFLNGEKVKLTAYSNGNKLVQSDGVAITAGTPTASNTLIIKAESSKDQTVDIYGSLNLKVGSKYYISTKPKTSTRNILTTTKEGSQYVGKFIQFGGSGTFKVSYDVGKYSSLRIYNSGSSSSTSVSSGKKGTYSYSSPKYLYFNALSTSKNDKVNIGIQGSGSEWKNSYTGTLTIKAAHVYSEFKSSSSFNVKARSLKPVEIGVGSAVGGVVVIVAAVVLYICKGHKKVAGSGSGSSSSHSSQIGTN